MLFELINPSDPYTFRAPSIEVAGAAVALLSTSFGAKCLDEGVDESTPVLFGWNEWLEDRGINDEWVLDNSEAIADALDSFLIGDARHREDVEAMLSEIPEDRREAVRNDRQGRNRSSMNAIGENAYAIAKALRARLAKTT